MTRELDLIHISGALLSNEFIEQARSKGTRLNGVQPADFSVPGREIRSQSEWDTLLGERWERLRERWEEIRRQASRMDISTWRSRWILPVLQALDFAPVYQRADTVVGEIRFPLSHRGWEGEGAPIIHTVVASQDLDRRPETSGKRLRSPQDLLQQYLNVTPQGDIWGIVTSGYRLRLLRQFHHSTVKGFVEFDLQEIFETRSFEEFRAFFRLAHASRFRRDGEGQILLERFYQHSLATGVAVGAKLRGNVQEALELLGNGFLRGTLLEGLVREPETCQRFYQELLHVVYRILFLLYAEQRGMLPGRTSLYAREYSITALRQEAEVAYRLRQEDDHTDLWERLKTTFRMMREGVLELEIFPYNGVLFAPEQTPLLNGSVCRNDALLSAIYRLTVVDQGGGAQRISFLDLGVEELGSIYESLLEFIPRVEVGPVQIEGRPLIAPRTFFLDPRGTSRKTSGSYYTHPSLVAHLVESALIPVLEERLAEAGEDRQAQEQALLSLKVVDPACGSGAFLIAATTALGQRLAQIRTGDPYPSEPEVRLARRDVLQHCIYGVDLNPLAVELTKVSLWIHAAVERLPLNFLDPHIRIGNSLVGVTPNLLEQGIPADAYAPVTGDDKAVARETKRLLVKYRKSRALTLPSERPVQEMARPFADLADMAEDTPQGVRAKEEAFAREISDPAYRQEKFLCDLWTAAFFWPLTPNAPQAPMDQDLYWVRGSSPDRLPGVLRDMVTRLEEEHAFFHWHLAFPEVFAGGGFDVVLGNPPWEKIKLQEEEFFATRDPHVAEAQHASERKRRIAALPQLNPGLMQEFLVAKRRAEAGSKFTRESHRFPLTAVGDINTYSLFAELVRSLLNPRGRAGLIVQTGIATDDTTKGFFQDIVEKGNLVSLFDFENRKKLFAEVDSRMRFCLLTLAGGHQEEPAEFAFFLTDPDELADRERRFCLTAEDFRLLNPNTRTCPTFRTRRDAEITRKIYSRCPVFVDETRSDGNPWGVRFLRMLDMSNDSHLFHMQGQMEAEGLTLDEDGRFVRDEEVYLPLYEAKMFHQFDARYATYEGQDAEALRKGQCRDLTLKEHQDPGCAALPRYWVEEGEVIRAVGGKREWFMAFRDVTNSTNERTAIFSILPWVGVGNNAPIMLCHSARDSALVLANINNVICDYAARQKVGGTHLNFFLLNQLPVFARSNMLGQDDEIVTRALELTFTHHSLIPFARELGYDGPPFPWDEDRRALLRAELNAIFTHLYGLTEDELAYILDTFPIVRKQDEARYGEYRTARLVLDAYRRFAPQFAREVVL